MSTSIKNHLSEYQVINNITETINYGSNCWKRYTTEERTDESGGTYKEPSAFDKYVVDDNSEAYPYEGFDSEEEYYYKNILVPDEQNRKTFLIKGKLINDLGTILQQGGAISSAMARFNNDFKSIVDALPTCNHTFSENMFGFIGFGIRGY